MKETVRKRKDSSWIFRTQIQFHVSHANSRKYRSCLLGLPGSHCNRWLFSLWNRSGTLSLPSHLREASDDRVVLQLFALKIRVWAFPKGRVRTMILFSGPLIFKRGRLKMPVVDTGIWRGWAYPSVYIQIPGYMFLSKPKGLLQVVMGGVLGTPPWRKHNSVLSWTPW